MKKLKVIGIIILGILLLIVLIGILKKLKAFTPILKKEEVIVKTQKDKAESVSVQESYQSIDLAENEQTQGKNIAVFGVDLDGYRTDVIFVVHINEAKITLISVPRDTHVDWLEEYKEIAQTNGWNISESKINEMLAFGKVENIEELTIKEIERILGLTIDNYIIITLDMFREAVDAIGGIEVDVPEGITGLEPGWQVLDGAQAEIMVRYRGYVDADLGRIKAQQILLEALGKQLMRPSTLFKVPEMIKLYAEKVTTNIQWHEIWDYFNQLKQIKGLDIKSYTVPGVARYKDGKSYFFIDEELTLSSVREWLER